MTKLNKPAGDPVGNKDKKTKLTTGGDKPKSDSAPVTEAEVSKALAQTEDNAHKANAVPKPHDPKKSAPPPGPVAFVPAEGVDPTDPASGRFVTLPTSGVRAFKAKAHFYKIEGRDGNGPCVVLDMGAVNMPNGDFALKGDTFNPLVERMTAARYRHLVRKKFITPAGQEIETKLLEQAEAKRINGK